MGVTVLELATRRARPRQMGYISHVERNPVTDFICVYFGNDTQNPGKWWNITARGFISARAAESHGRYMMPTAGVFGFAVIKETDNTWELIEDRSMLPPHYSIGTDGNCFSVQPAPTLQLV